MRHKWLIASILIAVEVGLCAIMLIASQTGIAQVRRSVLRWQFFEAANFLAESNDEHSFAVSGPSRLLVRNTHGLIDIRGGGPAGVVAVHLNRKAWGTSQSDAQAALDAFHPIVTENDNTVTIEPPPDEAEIVLIGATRPSPTFDVTVTVPGDTTVDARTTFGGIAVTEIAGNVAARTASGPLRVSNLSGEVDLHTTFGDINAERLNARALDAESDSGTLTLTDVNSGGAVNLTTSLGEVVWNKGTADSTEIETASGTVELSGVTVNNSIVASGSFASILLNRVQALSYHLRTASGKITVDGAQGTLEAASDLGDIQVTNGSGVNLDLQSDSGSLAYSGSLGSGPHRLTTGLGDVRLNIPRTSAVNYDLHSDLGELKSDFSIGGNDALLNRHWTGMLNGGGAPLTVETNSGSIYLDILNP